MELLIDGYNLFKQVAATALLSSAQMATYISILMRYVQAKGLPALLIFDGGMQERATYEQRGLLKIMHVGKNKTADDSIKDFVQEHRGKDVLLVSSDRELNRVADYYNVPSIDVLDFWQFVQNALNQKKAPIKKNSSIIKISNTVNPELDALMAGTKITTIKEDNAMQDRVSQSLRHSKIDKKLLQKIKKL